MEYHCDCGWKSRAPGNAVEFDAFQRPLCGDCEGFAVQDDDSELTPSEFLRLLNGHEPGSRLLGNVTQRQMVNCIQKLMQAAGE